MTAGFFRKCWPSPVLGATRLVAAAAGRADDEALLRCEGGSYGFLLDAAAAGAMWWWERLSFGMFQ
jgi:hypothetical protein